MSPVGNIGRRSHQFPYVNHSRMFMDHHYVMFGSHLPHML
jgi:hypothetical protein